MILATAFCINTPVVEMRESPSNDSKVVSQSYYSEQVEVVEDAGDWLKIRTTIDAYEGWIKNGLLSTPQKAEMAKVTSVAAHLYHTNDTEYGPRLTLPFEAQMEVIDKTHPRWIKVRTLDNLMHFIQRGDVTLDRTKPLNREEMLDLSEKFLHRPYTWGGRTSFGYDCSGFVQMLYRQMQVFLPRDTKDQINFESFKTIPQEQLKPGDLIYWGLDEKRIRHVGMYVGDGTFIHASARENKPYIRKSHLTDKEWDGTDKGDGSYAYRTFRALK